MGEFFNWLSSNPIITIVFLVIIGIAVSAVVIIYFVAFFQGRSISFWPPKIGEELSKESDLLEKQGISKVLLTQTGIVDILKNAQQADDIGLEEVTKSYWFMGISSQYAYTQVRFRERLSERGRQCRFLLLNPDSSYIKTVEEREGAQIKQNILTTIENIKEIRQRSNPNIEVRLYDELPIFRLVIVNEAKCFVSYYSTRRGVANPQLIFEDTKNDTSFYTPFLNLFLWYWEKSISLEIYENGKELQEPV